MMHGTNMKIYLVIRENKEDSTLSEAPSKFVLHCTVLNMITEHHSEDAVEVGPLL
jgi:hypothetical protein